MIEYGWVSAYVYDINMRKSVLARLPIKNDALYGPFYSF